MLGWLDIAIVLAYVAYSIAWGLRSSKVAGANLEEYFLAGRTLKGWEAGISMAATQFAADTPLVVTGLVATAGLFSLWRLWIYALAFLMMALVLGASWRRSGVITDAGLTEVRYSGRFAAVLRGAKAVYFGFIFNCTVLAMVLLAATRITEPFLLWDQWLPHGPYEFLRGMVQGIGFPWTASGDPCSAGEMCVAGAECIKQRCVGTAEWVASTNNLLSVGVIVAVTTLYSATGGLRSVVRTDIAQFAIAMVATLAYAVVVVREAGGLSALPRRLSELFPADGTGPGGMTSDQILALTPGEAQGVTTAVLGVIFIQWICQINADGSGYLAQRTMACRSDRDARSAGVVFTVAQILIRSLVWIPIAVGLLLVFRPESGLAGGAYTAAREATFVRGIAESLPPGFKGLMLTGMLGALASTLDTHLNWGSSYFTNDIYARFIAPRYRKSPSPQSLVWVARFTNVALLCCAFALMPLMDSIQTAWKASLLLGAGVGVVLVLRWLWWRMNAAGELASLVASVVLAPVLLWVVEDEAVRLLLQSALATVTAVGVALSTPPEPHSVLAEFYARTQPPGFWGSFAPEGGRDARRRLWNNLAAAFGIALSIFTVLVGVGSWLMSSPPPSWLPHRGLWIALNLTIGVASIPLWVRLARAGRWPEERSLREGTQPERSPAQSGAASIESVPRSHQGPPPA